MRKLLKRSSTNNFLLISLLILTLYNGYTIAISINLINKTYLIGKSFEVKVIKAYLEFNESEAKIAINYTIINPIDIKLRILSIRNVIYSDILHNIWNNLENYYSQEFIIKSTKIAKIVKFAIPQEKLKYILDKISIKTYVICEIMEPRNRRVILEFKETITI